MSIQILDCTLRDGGYINDWKFGKKAIISIIEKLENAGIDIIECGFLTGMVEDADCSLFNNIAQIKKVVPPKPRNAMYVAMIAMGEKELHPKELEDFQSGSIEGVRLTFHKNEIEQAFEWAQIIKDKGYKVFMQPVGTVFYSDIELLRLVDKINRLKPYAFYIVDTLGSMYRNEVSHRFYLIDENMDSDIKLGFHGHNNLQLAFSNAQVLGKIQTKRTLILDSSVYGMGRGAGNLPTELITQYINKNISQKYDVTMVMDIYDEYISAVRKYHEWGYTMPYHIAASHVCHPSYAAYLINRQTLTMKDIEKIIQSIPEEYKIIYDQKLIESLYTKFQSKKIDDNESVRAITDMISGRKVLLLAPGRTLTAKYAEIMNFINREKPFVISVNFVDVKYHMNACFISNHKRIDIIGREIKLLNGIQAILTSNITGYEDKNCIYVDYKRYINSDEMISDNAGLMLLRLMERCGAETVYLAGFDGFHHRHNGNYYSSELDLKINEEEVLEKQIRISSQLKAISEKIRIKFITPSVYDREGISND